MSDDSSRNNIQNSPISAAAFDTIVKTVTKHLALQKPTKPVFFDSDYEPVMFDSKNYYSLNTIATNTNTSKILPKSNSQTIAFIDGGNNEIFGNKVICMHIIRAGALLYTNGKRIEQIFNESIGVSSKINTQKLDDNNKNASNSYNKSPKEYSYTVTNYGQNTEQFEWESEKETCEDGIHVLRRLEEVSVAHKILQKLHIGDILIFDGTLDTKSEKEWEAMNKLLHEAEQKGIVIMGIIKSSGLATDSDLNAITATMINAPEKEAWLYCPLCSKTPLKHPVEICIAKLHELSSYAFVIEVATLHKKYNIPELQNLLSSLLLYSADPSFLGYPYGLLEADLQARCTNNEKTYLQARLISSLQSDAEQKMMKSLQTSAGAHSILDHLAGNKTFGELLR